MEKAGYEVHLVAAATGSGPAQPVRVHQVSPPKNRLGRMLLAVIRVGRCAYATRARIVHFHDPELIPTGVVLQLLGRKVIYDAHEDVPRDILVKDWLPAWIRVPLSWLAGLIEWGAARILTAVVTATPTIGARFPREKTVVINNYPTLAEFPSPGRQPAQTAPQFVYVGNIADVRGGREMVQAVGLLDPSRGAKLTLAGVFSPPAFEQELRARPEWERVNYRGWVDRAGVNQIFNEATAGLVLLHPIPTYLMSQPTKLFEYMAAGLPVIASDFAHWRSILDQHKCGLLVNPLDPQAIAHAMQWLLDHPEEAAAMGRRGREAIESRFNWEPEKQKLLALYAGITALN